MNARKYEWKESYASAYKKADPNKVGRELARIEKDNGAILPAEVVAAAKKTSSAMHCLFNWNDGSAAEKYREMQARNLIGAIRIVQVTVDRSTNEKTAKQVRLFINAAPRTNTGYRSVVSITKTEERDAIVARARRDLESWMDRYYEIADLFGVLFEEAVQAAKNKRPAA
jgi:hypothetical protein